VQFVTGKALDPGLLALFTGSSALPPEVLEPVRASRSVCSEAIVRSFCLCLPRLVIVRVWRASVVALLLASEDYVVDEDAARQSRANIWSGDFDMPWDWRSQRRSR
jgi:hypothetical protein